jgi:hypothetical protein
MPSSKLLVFSERFWPDGSGGELATYLITDILREEFEIKIVTGSKQSVKLPSVEYFYEPLFLREEKLLLWLNTMRLTKTERFKKLICESDVVYVPRQARSPHTKCQRNG